VPSVRHAAVAWYISRFLRGPELPDADAAAARILDGRRRERPTPPRRLQERLEHSRDSGFDVWTLRPSGEPGAEGRRAVYLHGGGYVADLTPQHWQLIERLSTRLAMTIVVPRYPIAPEATWRDSRDALRALVAPQEGPTVLIGDSAGGGLALALAQDLVRDGRRPEAVVLIAPWVDVTNPPLEPAVLDDPWLSAEGLRQCGVLWAGDDDTAHPAVSPLRGSMAGLPPVLVISGTRDILFAQAVALVAALREAGVPVEHEVQERLIHVYPLLPVPEAKRALDLMTASIAHPHQSQ
jgi:epsilon-lactone hydrolase